VSVKGIAVDEIPSFLHIHSLETLKCAKSIFSNQSKQKNKSS